MERIGGKSGALFGGDHVCHRLHSVRSARCSPKSKSKGRSCETCETCRARRRGPGQLSRTFAIQPAPNRNPAPALEHWGETHQERAAIIEYDGLAPRAWAEAVARLDPARPPGDVPPKRWLRFINDCGQFARWRLGNRAEDLGWGPLELFGCDRVKPFARLDHAGLLWLLKGGKLVALTAVTATIETISGARQTYRRCRIEVDAIAPPGSCAVNPIQFVIRKQQPLECVAIVSVDVRVSGCLTVELRDSEIDMLICKALLRPKC